MTTKIAKELVNYRAARGAQQCGNCSMYRDRFDYGLFGLCTDVVGAIRASGVCDIWAQGQMLVDPKFMDRTYNDVNAT